MSASRDHRKWMSSGLPCLSTPRSDPLESWRRFYPPARGAFTGLVVGNGVATETYADQGPMNGEGMSCGR